MRKMFGYRAAIAMFLAAMSGGRLAAQAPTLGTISVEAAGPVGPDLGAAMPVFVEAAGRALADSGFTTLEGSGHARLVADLRLSRTDVGTSTARVPVEGSSLSPGGSPSRVGGSLSVSLPTRKSKTVPLQQTRLEIRIRKRGEEAILWHGTAITVRAADTPAGRDETVATDLTGALLRSYPAQPEDVITVP